MRIKVFKASSLKEAMAMVKDELGRDAVILHTKQYKKGGFLGYKSKEIVEVTAAIEDVPKRSRSVRLPDLPPMVPNTFSETKSVVPKKVLAQYKTAGTEAGVAQVEQGTAGELTNFQPLVQSSPIKSIPVETVPPKIIKAEEAALQTQDIDRIEPLEQESEAKIQQLENELAQMKSMLVKVMSKDMPEANMISLQEALQQQEVDEEILNDIIAKLSPEIVLGDKLLPEVQEALNAYLARSVHTAEGIRLLSGRPRIVALIGATGVGKTTTLAKIAARFVLEQGVSAALITADTYRISAVEQLKTYSDIIGLPLEIVYSPAELKEAIRKHRNKQLILIDTAGRSQHNESQMQELKDFLAVDSSIEKHLVMSATTKNRDAKEILDKFSVCNPNRLIFTKTDETSSLGILVNLLYQRKISLSYLTNGQSVPDDIVPAKTEKITELLLR